MTFSLIVRIVYVNLWALFKLILDLSVLGFIATAVMTVVIYTFIGVLQGILY